MDHEIKKGLLDITPDLEASKTRIKSAVLQPQVQSKKSWLFPQMILGCLVLLSIFGGFTQWQGDEYVQGFSKETLNMYGLLDDNDPKMEYQRDLIMAKYGELKGVKLPQQDVENLIATYKSTLPHSFNTVLKKNGISQTAYEKQYLTLKAQVQLIRDSLLPIYENMYPQFHQEIQAQLLLLDAMEEVNQGDLSFGNPINQLAIVIYEGENARILALTAEKRLLEEQLIIMPKRDSLHLKTGDEILLEDYLITSIQTEQNFKQYVVSKNIKVITENKTKELPAIQQKVNTFFKQNNWQPLSLTEEPDMQLKTLNGVYSIWFGDEIVIGSGDQGIVINSDDLQKWGENLINN